MFQHLKSDLTTARRITGKSSFEEYEYYKLRDPVPLPAGDNPDFAPIVQSCLDRNKWANVLPNGDLHALSPSLFKNVYMVIQPRERTGTIITIQNFTPYLSQQRTPRTM